MPTTSSAAAEPIDTEASRLTPTATTPPATTSVPVANKAVD
jgi:hypothetical protein